MRMQTFTMTSLRKWDLSDLWHFNRVNIDMWTETFSIPFYLHYSTNWPEINWTARNNSSEVIGYILGSAQPNRVDDMIAHVTAVSISSDYRRLGLATTLMRMLEYISSDCYKAKCVSLYVRPSNKAAQDLYMKMGYKLYRKIFHYYDHMNEDGLDLRRSLVGDKDKVYEKEVDPLDADDLSDE